MAAPLFGSFLDSSLVLEDKLRSESPTNKRFDVIVVGGGPAGSAAAITAAGAGLHVLLVENAPFPRSRPGESLHPGIQPLIRQLGCEQALLNAQFERFSGVHVQWGSKKGFEPFGSDDEGPWLGFQACRAEFDQLLLDRARDVGVEIVHRCHAKLPLINNQRVSGIETTIGNLESKFVVDAAGGRHWLARELGVEVTTHSPRLVARYGYTKSPPYPHQLPALVSDKSGWTWYAKIAATRFHWTRLNLVDTAQKNSVCSYEFDGDTRGADVTWRVVERPAGPGYFTVGDAAAVLDPASSHGVLKAIMSGIQAGTMTSKIVQSPHLERELVSAFNHWWTSWFYKDVEQLRRSYREHSAKPKWVQ